MLQMNKKLLLNDIKSTLMKDIKESFAVIPKSNDIKRLLKESEFPFSFEVPFVLEEDLVDIVSAIRNESMNMPDLVNGYMLSFKDNSNTLIVRSKSKNVNDVLINIINTVQIYGTANQLSTVPLGAQETENDESLYDDGLAGDISSIIANSSTLCPTCSSVNTSMMGESIHFCRDCSSLFESILNDVATKKEDRLIDPEKAEDEIDGDVLLRKTDKTLEKEQQINEEGEGAGGDSVGMTTGDVATYETPTKFSKKQKDMFKRGTLK